MIKALAERLDKNRYVTHVFDAWRYRKDESIVLPLLQDIASKNATMSIEVNKSVKNIAVAVTLMSMNQIVKNTIGIDLKDVKEELKYAEERQKHYEKYINKPKEIEDEFSSMISRITNGNKSFVIFIDNLDRCLPDYVLNLLEDIANFFHSPNCIFVLSMDKNVVVHAIQEKYKNFSGERYLEKIVQVGLNMPLPDLDQSGSSHAIYHFLKRYERATGYKENSSAGDSRDKIYKELTGVLNLLFSEGFLNNPRRIEKYVNKFVILERMNLLDMEKVPTNIPFVIMIMVLKEQFPISYQSINDHRDLETLDLLLNFSVSTENSPARLKTAGRAGRYTYNELLMEEYQNSHEFYKFLKLFHQVVTNKGKSSDQKEFIKKYLEVRRLVSIID